jgi:two-component system OmpR family sensor kinase
MVASLAIFGGLVYAIVLHEEMQEARAAHEAVATDTLDQIVTTMLLAAPAAATLAIIASLYVTRRVMRPIDDVVQAAARMSAEDLNRRLPVPADDDELGHLVRTLNELFARLERGYAAQASFASDASHELRTPLAVVLAELEVALRRPRSTAEWEATANGALLEVRRAVRLADGLLRYARAGSNSANIEPVDLQIVIERVVSGHLNAVTQAGISLLAAPPDYHVEAFIAADADAVEAALGVVVKNAIRYTPRGGQIRLRLERADGWISIHVEDSGPGVAPEESSAIFFRFARGNHGLRADAEGSDVGSGLGLSMARRIAEVYGGTLAVSRSPNLHGARFTFAFPARARP